MARDRSEENEITTIPMRTQQPPYGIEGRPVTLRIATPVPGTVQILDAWVTAIGSSVRLTSVPVGSNFAIHVNFTATNTGGGQWTLAVTAIAPGTTVKNWRSENSGLFGGTLIARTDEILDVYGPNTMPAGTGALNIRIRMWMIDGNSPSPAMPPETGW